MAGVSSIVPARSGQAQYDPDPRGLRSAREAVAAYYASRNASVDPDDIILTASTSEAYAHLFRLLGNAGDVFLAPRPSYPLFEPLAELESVKLDHWRLAYDGAWHMDAGSLQAESPRSVILVQPNHPTGTCLSDDELANVEDYCARTGAALIADEVFGNYMWGADASAKSLLATPRRVPTFVLSGLSKVCGLPQLKLSWVVLAGPEEEKKRLREGLEWIADLFLSVGTPVQLALPDLLENRLAFQRQVHERIRGNRVRLDAAIARRPAMSVLRAEGGWVAVLRVPRTRSEEDWALELLRRGVVVHPGHFYDFEDEAHLVVSLIVEPHVFDSGLTVIEGLVGEG